MYRFFRDPCCCEHRLFRGEKIPQRNITKLPRIGTPKFNTLSLGICQFSYILLKKDKQKICSAVNSVSHPWTKSKGFSAWFFTIFSQHLLPRLIHDEMPCAFLAIGNELDWTSMFHYIEFVYFANCFIVICITGEITYKNKYFFQSYATPCHWLIEYSFIHQSSQ